jgi:hypothetical protein
VVDSCISLLVKEKKEKEYRIYVTDILTSILKSQFAEPINVPRYIDLVEHPRVTKPERTADEIIKDISQKLDFVGK